MICQLATITQRGMQVCHQPARFKTFVFGGKVLHLCKKHHAGLRCPHGAVRCRCTKPDHGRKK